MFLSVLLNKNQDYKDVLVPALNKAVAAQHEYEYQDEHVKAWIEHGDKESYLFFKLHDILTVCKETHYSGKQDFFSFQLKQIKSYEGFIPEAIIQINLSNKDPISVYKLEEGTHILDFEKQHNSKKHPTEFEEKQYQHVWRKMLLSAISKNGAIFESTDSKATLNKFHTHLLQQGYLAQAMPENILDNNKNDVAQQPYIAQEVQKLIPQLVQIRQLATDGNFTSKKKYIYNDGDYGVWIPPVANSVCFKSQEISFIAVSRNNDKDWQIYHFNNETSQHKEKSIIQGLVDGSLKKQDLVLLVLDNKVREIGEHFECMVMDAGFSCEEMQSTQQSVKKKSKLSEKRI